MSAPDSPSIPATRVSGCQRGSTPGASSLGQMSQDGGRGPRADLSPGPLSTPRTPAWLCRPWRSMPSCPMLAVSTSPSPWPPPTWTTRRPSSFIGPTRRFCRRRRCVFLDRTLGAPPAAHPLRCVCGGHHDVLALTDPQPPHGAVRERQGRRLLSDAGESVGTPVLVGASGTWGLQAQTVPPAMQLWLYLLLGAAPPHKNPPDRHLIQGSPTISRHPPPPPELAHVYSPCCCLDQEASPRHPPSVPGPGCLSLALPAATQSPGPGT